MTGLFLGLGAVLLAAIGLYALWARKVRAEIAEGADVAWSRFARDEPAMLEGVDRARFEAIYARASFPRFPKYFLASAAAFVVALPAALALLTAAAWTLERLEITPQPAELAKYVPLGEGKTDAGKAQREQMALYLAKDYAGFYYFFGVLGAWLAVLAVSMRFYHARRPGDVRDELLRARDDALTRADRPAGGGGEPDKPPQDREGANE